jgi:hypothetical protein
MKTFTAANLANLSNYSYCKSLSDRFDTIDTINYDGNTFDGMIFGDDECFDGDEFYQWFHTTDGQLFKVYYDLDGVDLDNLDSIDYSTPSCVKRLVPSCNLDPNAPIDLMFDVDSEEMI